MGTHRMTLARQVGESKFLATGAEHFSVSGSRQLIWWDSNGGNSIHMHPPICHFCCYSAQA
jgi:hypothetical protein